jgi:hypothetical protein
MSSYIATPKNSTVAISASTNSAQTYLDVGSNNNITTVLITNADPTNTAFINWSGTASTVTATTAGFPVPPYYPVTLQINTPASFDSNVTIAAITATGTAQVYITPVAYVG